MSLLLLVGVAGCSVQPLSKQKLIEEAVSVAHGEVLAGEYKENDSSSIITVTDAEYGFEFEVKSEVGTVSGAGLGTLTNPLTGKAAESVSVYDTFYTNYISYFFTCNDDVIADIESRYGVAIPDPKFQNPHQNDFLIVFGCENEDDAEEIFEELSDRLEEYDSRGYFLATDGTGNLINGYKIVFVEEDLTDDLFNNNGVLMDSGVLKDFTWVKSNTLEPDGWD